jgi:hypothetical protein
MALRGWFPIEILHFPVRSLEHCLRKYVTQFVALERNAVKGIPNHMADAYRAYRDGALGAFYAPLVVDDAALERGIAHGELAVDLRLRDVLRTLGFGEMAESGSPIRLQLPTMLEDAVFAGEYSALQESDLGLAYGSRIDELERRLR